MIKNVSWIFTVLASTLVMAGDPALPGHHPLSQVQAGRLLMAELRCASCHADLPRDVRFEKAAPDLVEVGTRISPEFLRRFLASPSSAHPGTTMPDMLSSKSESEKQAIAESLAHFLTSQSRPARPGPTKTPIDYKQGNELYHTIGCVACHGPKEIASTTPHSNVKDEDEEDDPVKAAGSRVRPSIIDLSHVSSKYTVMSLSEFLFQPLKVRSSGRMPDMKLTMNEAMAIAGYLVGEQRRKAIHWFRRPNWSRPDGSSSKL